MPVVKGGSERIVEAFSKVIEAHGGQLKTGMHVEKIITQGTPLGRIAEQQGLGLMGRTLALQRA